MAVAARTQVFAAVKAPAPSVPQVIVPLGVFAPLARVTVAVQTVPLNTVTGLVAQLTVVVVLAREDSPTAKSLMAVTPVACVLVAVRVPLVVADHVPPENLRTIKLEVFAPASASVPTPAKLKVGL